MGGRGIRGGWEAEDGLNHPLSQTKVCCVLKTATMYMSGQDSYWQQFDTTYSLISAPQLHYVLPVDHHEFTGSEKCCIMPGFGKSSHIATIYIFAGQFLTSNVEIDTKYNLMRFNNRKPISVRKGPAWPYLHINEECWYGTATDNQGTGVIEGNYMDYIVKEPIL